jgi:hypothetical protein
MKLKVYLVTENVDGDSYIHAFPFTADGLIEAHEQFYNIALAQEYTQGEDSDEMILSSYSHADIYKGIEHGCLEDCENDWSVTITESEA